MQGSGRGPPPGDADMTVEEFNTKLEKFQQSLVTEVYRSFIDKKAGYDVRAMIVSRILDSGMSGNNVKFKPYSRRPLWVGYSNFVVNTKATYTAGKKAADRWATIKTKSGKNAKLMRLPGGYAELRRLQGLQIAFKDFWVRGGAASMWSNFGMIDYMKRQDGFKIVFGGQTEEAQDIIDGQSDRENQSIIALTEKEVEDLQQMVYLTVERELKRQGI